MADPNDSQSADPQEAEPPDGPEQKSDEGKKKKKKKKRGNLSSARGIETMFRTAYREQLDHTALADSKANIMIQLNGVIVSIMLASSGLIMESHPWLLLPCGALTLTALISIVFAVLAARPSLNKLKPMTFEDIRSGRSNILFFGNFARITEDQFVEGMLEMLSKTEQVYLNMTRHLHGLGTVLLRKFRLLRIAYTVFLVGLFVSSSLFLFRLYTNAADAPHLEHTGFNSLPGLYEPSGVVQLGDGRVLVVEDEADRPMALLTFEPSGKLAVGPEFKLHDADTAHDPTLHDLDDLEGAAIDAAQGFVYVITSFDSGDESRPEREKLVRFKIAGSTLAEPRVRADLRPSLLQRIDGELNVEALAVDVPHQRLLLGLRSPLQDGKALLIPIAQAGLFDESPTIGQPIALDMGGEGIRAMAYDADLGGLVLIGHRDGAGTQPYNMWLWDGQHQPHPIRVEGTDLRRAEGITPVVIQGHKRLLIVSDEGKRKKGKAAGYILLRYDQLSVES